MRGCLDSWKIRNSSPRRTRTLHDGSAYQLNASRASFRRRTFPGARRRGGSGALVVAVVARRRREVVVLLAGADRRFLSAKVVDEELEEDEAVEGRRDEETCEDCKQREGGHTREKTT